MIYVIIFLCFLFMFCCIFVGLFYFFYKSNKKVYLPSFENTNYLNHDFSDPTLYECDMRKCKKCGILGYYHGSGERAGKVNTIDPMRISGSTYPIIILTCEEMIIKNIIE